MFDIAPTELLLCAIVALLVIGPKDLPKAMRTVGYWVGRVRGMARHFRTGFDAMVREAELEEMERKWAQENERIMREHPSKPEDEQTKAQPQVTSAAAAAPAVAKPETDLGDGPVQLTERPEIRTSDTSSTPAATPQTATEAARSHEQGETQLDFGLDREGGR